MNTQDIPHFGFRGVINVQGTMPAGKDLVFDVFATYWVSCKDTR